MCKPIADNTVRARKECIVKPLSGSSDHFAKKRSVVLKTSVVGIVADQPAQDDDHRIVMFDLQADDMPGAMLVAELHCDNLKGVEAR
jgi:predicted deacylase